MISLNDQPLTTRHFPHSSLLCADWLSSALSRHASMNGSKVLTYTQNKREQICWAKMFLYKDEMHIWWQMDSASTARLLNLISYEGAVTSVQGGLRFGPRSRFLYAVWKLSPCLRALPLVPPLSSHAARHAAFLGLILPLNEVPASELELVPGRGAVMANSS